MSVPCSFDSPWQKPLFIYGRVNATQKEFLETQIKDFAEEGWRLCLLQNQWVLGKIFDKVLLSSFESIQEHIYSHFRQWGLDEKQVKLWISSWCEGEPS